LTKAQGGRKYQKQRSGIIPVHSGESMRFHFLTYRQASKICSGWKDIPKEVMLVDIMNRNLTEQ
jgi:hypothetical protein